MSCMARGKKTSFKDMTPGQQRLTLLAIAVALVLIFAAERDNQRRPDAEVNGNKLFWRVVSLNALGALSYFRWGRRDAPA